MGVTALGVETTPPGECDNSPTFSKPINKMKTIMLADFTKDAVENAVELLMKDGWLPVGKVSYLNDCYFQTMKKS